MAFGHPLAAAQEVAPGASLQELFDPPRVRDVLRRAALYELRKPAPNPREWAMAAFYIGLSEAYAATRNPLYLEPLTRVAEDARWRPGPDPLNADDHAIAQVYLDLWALAPDASKIAPFREAVERLLTTEPRRSKAHQFDHYWWSDALFMSPPAIAGLAGATGDVRYLDLVDRLWASAYAELWDAEERLFLRDLRFGEGRRRVFWSRGNGWVAAGLARLLERLPGDRPRRPFYEGVLRELSERVAGLQWSDGLWRSDLLETSPTAPPETSGTALFCYAMAWGVRSGVLQRDRYLPVIERAWSALTERVDGEGRLGWVQSPTIKPGHVAAGDSAPYGTGALLLAGSEILRLAEAGGGAEARSGPSPAAPLAVSSDSR